MIGSELNLRHTQAVDLPWSLGGKGGMGADSYAAAHTNKDRKGGNCEGPENTPRYDAPHIPFSPVHATPPR